MPRFHVPDTSTRCDLFLVEPFGTFVQTLVWRRQRIYCNRLSVLATVRLFNFLTECLSGWCRECSAQAEIASIISTSASTLTVSLVTVDYSVSVVKEHPSAAELFFLSSVLMDSRILVPVDLFHCPV